MKKVEIGEVLVCIKYHEQYNNANIIGKKYIVNNIVRDMAFVSTDLLYYQSKYPIPSDVEPEIIEGDGVSSPYSIDKNPDKSKPHSSNYLFDYFITLSEERESKINELLS